MLKAQILNVQLNNALNTDVVIEQAKVTERRGLEIEKSFRVLRTHARNHNPRLADIAVAVVDGSLTPGALTP